jgi:hypothetical protein
MTEPIGIVSGGREMDIPGGTVAEQRVMKTSIGIRANFRPAIPFKPWGAGYIMRLSTQSDLREVRA